MAIDYDTLLAAEANDVPVSYDADACILYALAVGFSSERGDAAADYLLEHRGPCTVPSMAGLLTPESLIRASGVDMSRVLHLAEAVSIYRPMPPAARMLANQRVVRVVDRGARLGAEISLETELRLARNDAVVCSVTTGLIARADGGTGGPAAAGPAERPAMPLRNPDLVSEWQTSPDQAILFRLAGDRNPLHVDPSIARRAGFERPILHGRCTFGIACHAILKTVCNYDFTLIGELSARFSSPVFPGDRVTTEMWQDGNDIAFRCTVRERNAVVVSDGRCVLNG